jgi:hypothetical protein
MLDKVAGKAKVEVAVFVIMAEFSHKETIFCQRKFFAASHKNNLTTAKNAVK